MSAFWFCGCRHPNTKVYYADTAAECAYYRDILQRIANGWETPKTLAQFALDWRKANIELCGKDPFESSKGGNHD